MNVLVGTHGQSSPHWRNDAQVFFNYSMPKSTFQNVLKNHIVMFVGPFEAAAATIGTGLGCYAAKTLLCMGLFFKKFEPSLSPPGRDRKGASSSSKVEVRAHQIIPTATPDPDDRWHHRMSELLRGLPTRVKSPCSNEELSN